jgi:TPR repeat protein
MRRVRAAMFCLSLGAALAAGADDATPVAATVCPFRVQDFSAPDLTVRADAQIAAWRAALARDANDPGVRQAMADYAVNLLLRANRLDAAGRDRDALALRRYVLAKLPDTDWRIQHQAGQGDVGAIDARLAWLRTARTPDGAALCALAARGAELGSAEANYRLALCTDDAADALPAMQRAAALGHAAAMETVGRLCLSGRLPQPCAFEGLCRAAQSGRIGAASAIGWRLTDPAHTAGAAVAGDGAAWLQRAAEAGDALAQNNLGEWHERHNGSTGGGRLALQWYRRAADLGLPAAMVNAARLLAPAGGAGCVEARSLLDRAAAAGLAQATEWREALRCGP